MGIGAVQGCRLRSVVACRRFELRSDPSERPTSFSTSAGAGSLLFAYHRDKSHDRVTLLCSLPSWVRLRHGKRIVAFHYIVIEEM